MKKIIIMLLAAVCLIPAAAQRNTQSKAQVVFSKDNVLFLGPKLGATFTSMGQPNEVDLYDGSGFGFSAGAALKARFGKSSRRGGAAGTGLLGLGLEAKYKQNKVKTIGSDPLSIGYLEIPVSAQVYPFYKSTLMNTFYLEAGPSFALTMSKSPDVLTVASANIAYHTGDFKGGDLRLMLGLGYTIPDTSLDVNARYYLGTSDLAANFNCKMNTLEVSFAWLFQIGKF